MNDKNEISQQQISTTVPQTVVVHVDGPEVRALDKLLSLDVNIEEFNNESGHSCAYCSYLLCEESSEILDNLSGLELPEAATGVVL